MATKLNLRYIYDYVPHHTYTGTTFQKEPVACVACVDGYIGISIRNDLDRFIKARARQIALDRAAFGSSLKIPNRKIVIKTAEGYKRIQLIEAIGFAASKLLDRDMKQKTLANLEHNDEIAT